MKRNVLKNIFFSLVAVLSLGTAFSVAKVAVDKSHERVVESKANWTQSPTIYFSPSDNWLVSNASFEMHYWNSSSQDSWQKGDIRGELMADLYNGRKVYKFEVTDTTHYPNYIQFVRYKNDYSEEWNRSGNITISDYYWEGVDTIIMDAGHSWWNSWVVGTNDGTNTIYWLNTKDYVLKASECSTPSNDTIRIFFYNSDTHWASGGKSVIRAWGGSASKSLWDSKTANTAYNLTWFQDDNGTYYGYADIPSDATKFQIAEFNAADDVGAGQATSTYYSQELTFSVAANRVIYAPAEGNTMTFGGAHNDVCGKNLMTKVLEAIDTCKANQYNGFNAYDNIHNYFYSHATAAAQSATVTTLNGNAMTVSDHMAGLLARKGGNSDLNSHFGGLNIFAQNGNSNSLLIIIVTIAALSILGGYFFIRRKASK